MAEWKPGEEVALGSLGLSLEEGKNILAGIQIQMVAAQVERDGQGRRNCIPLDVPFRVRQRPGARLASEGLPRMRRKCNGAIIHAPVLHGSGTALLERQTGGAGTVRQRGGILNEGLPATAVTNAAKVRSTPSETLVIGLDGDFVKSNRPLWERNFEITAGKLLGEESECTP